MDALKTLCLTLSTFVFTVALTSCGNFEKGKESKDTESLVDVSLVEEVVDILAVEHTDMNYDRYQTELSRISQDPHFVVIYADEDKIWYVHLKSDDQPVTYANILTVYDSQNDKTSSVNMNKTDFPDDEVFIHAFTENGGKISVIMEEMRNSDGWVEGTSVWTFDTSKRRWKPVAQGVSGAEFVKNGSAVKITEAKDLTPDEPTFAKEYSYSYRTITL